MTNDVFRVPLVAWHDYDAFRALLKEAPSVHHEWAERFRKRSMEERRLGHRIHEIHVDPHRFAAYLRREGCDASFATLDRFLVETDRHEG